MRVFATREVEEAVAYSKAGGVALHLHRIIPDRATAPRCFVQAVDRGEYIAHLFCLDKTRLLDIARRCGVRVLHIDRHGTDGQHIDLCAGPLRAAYKLLDADQADKLAVILAELKSQETSRPHE